MRKYQGVSSAADNKLVPLPQHMFCRNAMRWAVPAQSNPTVTPTTGNRNKNAFSLGVRRANCAAARACQPIKRLRRLRMSACLANRVGFR